MADEKKMRLSAESKATMFGKLLSRVATARYHTKQLAQEELWRRHGLGNPKMRAGWKMAEAAVVHKDGTEIVEYRLYKLMDRAVITIKSEVTTTTEFGTDATEEELEHGGKNND